MRVGETVELQRGDERRDDELVHLQQRRRRRAPTQLKQIRYEAKGQSSRNMPIVITIKLC